MNGTGRVLRVCIAATSLAALASCTSLPDTSGFTGATTQLSNSVRVSGDILKSELDRGIAAIPADVASPTLAENSAQFTKSWGVTVKSLEALSQYAESIEALTAAGNNGAANAQSLAKSVEGLAGAAGLAPVSATGTLLIDTASQLYGEFARLNAARSLRDSLEAADPIVIQAMDRLARETSRAGQLFRVLIAEQRNSLDRQCDHPRDVERSLDALALEVARTATGSSDAHNEAKATRLRLGREAIAPRLEQCRNAEAAIDARERQGVALMTATKSAVGAWSNNHTKLLTAIRERRPVSIQSLLAASEDVRTLITRWRDL